MAFYKHIIAAAAVLLTTGANAAELIANGDFSAGNSGFASTYSYQTYSASDGTYYIGKNASSLCGCWANLDDHTTGAGNYMILDGAQSGLDFFNETFAIVAGTTYTLSFWAAQLGNGPAATITASFNDAILGTGLTPGGTAWEKYSFTFNSAFNGQVSSATIRLSDAGTGWQYNDFAVDDVSFTGAAPAGGVPEPSSWALLMAGFGLIGTAARRTGNRAPGVSA